MSSSSDPFVLGLTGNIGSGKSTVANLWKRYNARIIEGDVLGREVADTSTDYREWLRERFGPSIFEGQELKRAELGRIVFADEQARNDMNAAIWPYIRDLLQTRIDDALSEGMIALVDAAMIFEWQDQDRYDVIVSVIIDPNIGAQRAAERLNLSVHDMLQRYRMQIPAEEKSRRSDFTIRNDGTVAELRSKAFGLWPHIQARGREAAQTRRNS